MYTNYFFAALKKCLLLFVFGLLVTHISLAQNATNDSTSTDSTSTDSNDLSQDFLPDSVVVPQERTSPMAIAKYKEADLYIKIVYSQPFKRGRQVFGELEPYGKVWRTGANEATEITTTKDIRIGGKELKAGTYTIFTIPDKEKWKIILNSELGQWGAYKYNKEKDLFSVEVPVQESDLVYEAFTISLEETKTGADMLLQWDTTKVAVPITFNK